MKQDLTERRTLQMSAGFKDRDQWEFDPSNNGIDWRARDIARLALIGANEPKPVWFTSGDGLDQQCTQNNTTVFINQVADEMDAIQVYDKRDNQCWMWYREQLGDETFDKLWQALIPHAQLMSSYYPREDVVDMYLKRQVVNDADHVPQGWE
ncbi:MAG: hypothetical protein NVS1B10_08870 [Candidatus Saccharimonadales bacterium]